jgi:hypothetical protein
MFTVIGTDTYLQEIANWSKIDKEAAKKLPKKLAKNPFIGDTLSHSFLREKRVKEKRVYYLIYKDLKLVLLVATSGKKDQQKTIDHIKENLDEFKRVAEKVAKQVS